MNPHVSDQEIRTLSVRIPISLYLQTQQIAQRSHISINSVVNEALAKIVNEAHDQEMYEAATLLGMDAEGSDVEFAIAAQSEVILAND